MQRVEQKHHTETPSALIAVFPARATIAVQQRPVIRCDDAFEKGRTMSKRVGEPTSGKCVEGLPSHHTHHEYIDSQYHSWLEKRERGTDRQAGRPASATLGLFIMAEGHGRQALISCNTGGEVELPRNAALLTFQNETSLDPKMAGDATRSGYRFCRASGTAGTPTS